MDATEADALRHLSLAERRTRRVAPIAPIAPLRCVGVIGAGVMGPGIAAAALAAGYRVVLVAHDEAARARAGAFIAATPGASANLTLQLDLAAVASCDLIIEVIQEEMAAKTALLARLARLAPQAILATNTSYLNLDDMGGMLPQPERLIGLHFFNPAHLKKLLEVTPAARTAPDVLAAALAFGRRLGKICVIAAVAEGFIANRIFNAYRQHCEFLVEDGASPQQVDAALEEFGFSLGPFAVADRSGLDIAWRMRRRLAATRDPRARYVALADRLCDMGRLGRKTGCGWYFYDDSAPAGRPDPVVDDLIAACARETGRSRRAISAQEIVDRALGAMINEARLVLADGIAQTSADVDLVMVHGHRFPAHKGGPLFWADRLPPAMVAAMIDQAEAAQGFGFRRHALR